MNTLNDLPEREEVEDTDEFITKRGSLAGAEGRVTAAIVKAAIAEEIETSLGGDISAKANIASPTFTGTPAAPAPAEDSDSTQIAVTAWVKARLAAEAATKAPIASPTFTGTPLAPTPAAADDNSTKIPTTAWVNARIEALAEEPSASDSAERMIKAVTQNAHGFTAEQAVYDNNGTWALARANAIGTSRAVGVIETVPGVNSFVVVLGGEITLAGKTPNTPYYLSDATAGLLTATPPTASSSFQVEVLRASTAVLGYVEIGEPLSLALIGNTDLAQMAPGTLKGNVSGVTSTPADVTLATIKAALGLVKADVGLSAVANALQLLASALDDDENLVADAADRVPSQRAVKAFVETNAVASPIGIITLWPRADAGSIPAGWVEDTTEVDIGDLMFIRHSGPVVLPTLISATIDATGTELTLVFSEPVVADSGDEGDFTLDSTGAAVTLAYDSTVGSTVIFTLSRTVLDVEVLTLDYTQPGSGVEDADGNDLATFTGEEVTNDSTEVGGGGASFTDDFSRSSGEVPLAGATGAEWEAGAGAFGDMMISALGKAGSSGFGGSGTTEALAFVKAAHEAFAADQSASITINSGHETFIGPAVRIQGAGDGSGYMIYHSGGNVLKVFKCTDTGTRSMVQMGADMSVPNLAAGDILTLEASGAGTTTLTVKKNGASQGTRDDSSSPWTSGQPGFWAADSVFCSAFAAADL